MAAKKALAPAGKVALYEQLVAHEARVELKGAASRYTSCNGHMFSFMDETGALASRSS